MAAIAGRPEEHRAVSSAQNLGRKSRDNLSNTATVLNPNGRDMRSVVPFSSSSTSE
jgi:hypothetical protein